MLNDRLSTKYNNQTLKVDEGLSVRFDDGTVKIDTSSNDSDSNSIKLSNMGEYKVNQNIFIKWNKSY